MVFNHTFCATTITNILYLYHHILKRNENQIYNFCIFPPLKIDSFSSSLIAPSGSTLNSLFKVAVDNILFFKIKDDVFLQLPHLKNIAKLELTVYLNKNLKQIGQYPR